MFSWKNMKTSMWISPLIWSYEYAIETSKKFQSACSRSLIRGFAVYINKYTNHVELIESAVTWSGCIDAQTDVNLRYSHMSHGWLHCGPAQTLIKVYERHEL